MRQDAPRTLAILVTCLIGLLSRAASAQCPTDGDGDGKVDGVDLAAVLANWGPCAGGDQLCIGDANADGRIDGADLAAVLADWGVCLAPPHGVTGASLWLDAASLASLADGAVVNIWPDRSGSGRDAVRAVGAPTYVANAVNGLPAVRFPVEEASFDFARISDIRTVFWVVRRDAVAAGSYHFLLGDDTSYDFHGDTSTLWDPVNASPVVRDGSTKVMGRSVDGTALELPATSYQVISVVTTGDARANQLSSDRACCPGRSWIGDIAEVLVYPRALTPIEENTVGAYLSAKYALPTFYQQPAMALSFGLNIPGSSAVIGAANGNAASITWTVPFGTDLSTLAPTYTLTSGTGYPASGTVPVPGFDAGPVTYTFTFGGITRTYVVTVQVAAPSSGELIRAVGATAQSQYFHEGMDDRRAIHAIDGSGMGANAAVRLSSTCSVNPSPTMWLSAATTRTWITFDLGAARTVAGIRLWNYNEGGDCGVGRASARGIQTCDVYRGTSLLPTGASYGAAGSAWGTFVQEMNFEQSLGLPRQPGQTHLFNSPISTRYLQLKVLSNFGDCDGHTGLSEIAFIDVASMLSFGGNVAGSSVEIGATVGNQTAIQWTVPYGTDLATLAPTYELSSGVGYPASGSRPKPGFDAGPVHYTVTWGGTMNTYVVSVSVMPPPPPPAEPPTEVFVVQSTETGLAVGDYAYLALVPASAHRNNGLPAVVMIGSELEYSSNAYFRDYLRRLRPARVNTLNFTAVDNWHPTARINATDPHELAVSMALAHWASSATVVLVSDAIDATNYPNVLQASALASAIGAPMLFHSADPLKAAAVQAAIADLGATEVVFVGAPGASPGIATRVVTGPASIVGYLASRGIAVEYFAVTNPRDLAVDTGAKLSLTAAHIAARRGGIVVPIAGFQPPTAQQELFVYSGYPIISAELNQLYAAIGRYPEYLAIVGNARSMPMSYSAPNESDGQFHDPPTDFDYANADADPFADIAVGRIMAYDVFDATLAASRISTYERLLDGTWNRTLAGVGADWDASIQAAAAANYGFAHLDLTGVDLVESDQAVEAGIIVNNFHSAAVTLGGSISCGSTNILAPAVVLSSGCAVGAIDFEMLGHDGTSAFYRGTPAVVINDLFRLGAVGVLASTRADTGGGSMVVSKMLDSALAGNPLGRSWMDGCLHFTINLGAWSERRMSMHFGDPALRMHVPSAPAVPPASHTVVGDDCGAVVQVSIPQTLFTPQMDPGMCAHWGLSSPKYWGTKAGLHGSDVDAFYVVRCTTPKPLQSLEDVEGWPIVRSWVWGDIGLGLVGSPVMDVLRDGTTQAVWIARANIMDWEGAGGGTVPLASATSMSFRLRYATGKEITSFRSSFAGSIGAVTSSCPNGVITLHVPPQTTNAQINGLRPIYTLDEGATCNQPNNGLPTPRLSTTIPVNYVITAANPADPNPKVFSVLASRDPAPFRHAPWTSDASSGISSSVPHIASVNFAGPAVTVNGVNFAASALSGPNFAIRGGLAAVDNAAPNITGSSAALGSGFLYGGNPRTVSLFGLAPGATYETTLFSFGWEPSGRLILFEANGTSSIIDQDVYGLNQGVRFMHRFVADASGSHTIRLACPPGAGETFHLCAMTTAMIQPAP